MCVFFLLLCPILWNGYFWLKTNSKNSISCSARTHLHWDCARHLVKNVLVQIDFNVDCWFWCAILFFSFTQTHLLIHFPYLCVPVFLLLISLLFVIWLGTICKYCEQNQSFLVNFSTSKVNNMFQESY